MATGAPTVSDPPCTVKHRDVSPFGCICLGVLKPPSPLPDEADGEGEGMAEDALGMVDDGEGDADARTDHRWLTLLL